MEEGKTTSISCSILTIPKNMNHRPKGRVHLSWSRITFVQPLAIYSISACEARHKILLNLFRKKKYGNRWRVFYNKQNKTILSSNYIILHFTSLNQRLIWLDFPLFFFHPNQLYMLEVPDISLSFPFIFINLNNLKMYYSFFFLFYLFSFFFFFSKLNKGYVLVLKMFLD